MARETDFAFPFAIECPQADIAHRGRPLSVDDLGGVLLRINDRDNHDRISLLNFSSGS